MHVCTCVSMFGTCAVYMYMFMCACTWRSEVNDSVCFLPFFFFFFWELTSWAGLAGQCSLGILMSVSPQSWDYGHMLLHLFCFTEYLGSELRSSCLHNMSFNHWSFSSTSQHPLRRMNIYIKRETLSFERTTDESISEFSLSCHIKIRCLRMKQAQIIRSNGWRKGQNDNNEGVPCLLYTPVLSLLRPKHPPVCLDMWSVTAISYHIYLRCRNTLVTYKWPSRRRPCLLCVSQYFPTSQSSAQLQESLVNPQLWRLPETQGS